MADFAEMPGTYPLKPPQGADYLDKSGGLLVKRLIC
jgi:hypothetical protein